MLAFLLTLFLAAQGIPNTTLRPTGVITGQIRSADDTPAVGLRVAAMAAPDENAIGGADILPALFSQTQTDDAGRYRLEGVPSGRYYVVAGRVDAPTYYPGTMDSLTARTISIASGSPIEGIDFTASATSVTRTVTSDFITINQGTVISMVARFTPQPGSRLPLASSRGRVKLSIRSVSISPSTLLPSAIVAVASAVGTFYAAVGGATRIVTGLAPAESTMQADGTTTLAAVTGEYRLSVDNLPDDYEVKSMSIGSVDLLKDSLQVNSPMSPDIQVVVGPKNQPPARSGRTVRGRALDGITGKESTLETVYLSGKPGTIFADGSFEFSGVANGQHFLQGREGWPGGRIAEVGVVAGTRDVTANIVYNSIPAAVRIDGRVVVEGGGAPLTNGRVLIANSGLTPIAVAADGTFKTSLPEGAYNLSVSGFPPGLGLKSISSGSLDLLNQQLRIQPQRGPVAPEIVVTFTQVPRVRVGGRVVAVPPTRPVEGAAVTLRDGPETYRATAAADGAFEMPRVLPGSYTLTIQHFGFTNVTETVVVADQELNLRYESSPLY